MRCPACGAAATAPDAAFCARCGAALARPEGEATDRLETPARSETPAGDTAKLRPADEAPPGRGAAGEVSELVGDAAASVRTFLVRGGWTRATEAAALVFAALLALGALIVLLAKLLEPGFGTGENPLWVVTRIVLAALWTIGVAIDRAGAGNAVLPLGLLMLVGWIAVAAARRSAEQSGAATPRERVLEGMKMGPPLAVMCFLSAVLFRIRDGVEVGADPGAALIVPLLWGVAFGALGGALSGTSPGRLLAAAGEHLERARAGMRVGVWGGALMLLATFVAAAGVVLLFLLANVVAGGGAPLSLAEVFVFLVVLVAFLPNAVIGAAAFATGAPLEFLARTIDGAGAERRASLILGGEGARGYAYVLLLIPAAACFLGGYAARRRAGKMPQPWVVLAAAASTYAGGLWLLTMLAGVRISQAFIGSGNFLVVAADPWATLLLAALWALVFGFAGWRLAESQAKPS